MKKTAVVAFFAILVLIEGFPVTYGASKPAKTDARHVIERTAAIIMTAQRFAAQGQKFEGLGLAVTHQLLARDLFKRNIYSEAIFHSLRARVLAARVVTLNKNDLLKEALYDRLEEKYARETPSGRELDQKLTESNVEIIGDRAAANSQMNLDVE